MFKCILSIVCSHTSCSGAAAITTGSDYESYRFHRQIAMEMRWVSFEIEFCYNDNRNRYFVWIIIHLNHNIYIVILISSYIGDTEVL